MASFPETIDPASPRGPAPDRAIAVAFALALMVHLTLIASVEVLAPHAEQPPRPGLELMVITEPGQESTASVDALVAAQDRRAGETQTPLPEIETDGIETNAEGPTEITAERLPEIAFADATADRLKASPAALVSTDNVESEPSPTDPALEATAPPPAPIIAAAETAQHSPAPPSKLRPILDLEPLKDEDIEELDSIEPPTEPPSEPRRVLPEQPLISAADIFASRDAEMANLAARIQERSSAYASRVRRKAVSTATTEYIYATYMEAWRRKVERIGNLNYPSEARELGLFGSLILHVAVRSDGSLEGIRVVRSSGHEVLDQAAIRIVQLAAPFAPFPPNIKRETDVLDITRTWQFQRNHELGWGR